MGAALAHVAVAADHHDLAGDHDVGGPLDAVGQRFAAAVEVVELALGDRVVDVDGREEQGPAAVHVVEAMHAGSGLFAHAADFGDDSGEAAGVFGQAAGERGQEGPLFFVLGLVGVGHFALGLELDALVSQQGEVAAVVQQEVRPLGVLEAQDLGEDIIPVGLELLALPGEDRHAGGGDGGGGVVLGRVDVAACPGDFRAEFDKRLDQHGGLDGHVQAAGDMGPGQGLGGSIFPPQGHQAGHFVLRQLDFLAAPIGQGHVGNFIRQLRFNLRHGRRLLMCENIIPIS